MSITKLARLRMDNILKLRRHDIMTSAFTPDL